ncbi:MAG: exonuclease SbcCD subunit D [Bryobacterales bacterium]|nr:exonuclease SbcCD subunit D [Bryobacterales bacterium]
MRFLHTADWHLGKSLRGRSRLDEQQRCLEELTDIATRENVDTLLMAGDLFDSHSPTAEAEKLAYQFFAELLSRRIKAVVIAGNHDHPRRIQALGPLVEKLGIRFCHFVGPDSVFEMDDARIAVLPWVPEHKLVDAESLMGATADRAAEYSDRMSLIVDQLCASFSPDRANVLMGHLFVYGAEATGSERAIHLTKPYALAPQRFPATASYIALGHLHKPQEIAAASPVVYSGSLLQLDFGEEGQQKRVTIVDAKPGRKAKIDSIPLTAGRRLRSVAGTLKDLKAQSHKLATGDLLRVTVQLDKYAAGIADQVREFLPEALDVRLEVPQLAASDPVSHIHLSPQELFRKFCEYKLGGTPSDALIKAFEESYASHSA